MNRRAQRAVPRAGVLGAGRLHSKSARLARQSPSTPIGSVTARRHRFSVGARDSAGCPERFFRHTAARQPAGPDRRSDRWHYARYRLALRQPSVTTVGSTDCLWVELPGRPGSRVTTCMGGGRTGQPERRLKRTALSAAGADDLRCHRPHRRGDYNAALRVARPRTAECMGRQLPGHNADRSIHRRGGLDAGRGRAGFADRKKGPHRVGISLWPAATLGAAGGRVAACPVARSSPRRRG